MSMNRREFVQAGALVGAGIAASGTAVIRDRMSKSTGDPVGEGTIRHLTILNNVKPQANEDVLILSRSSSAGELHPCALTEPYVKLSFHTAHLAPDRTCCPL